MKIPSRALCLALALALLCGCRGWNYLPDVSPDVLWVSTDPDIWFVGFDEETGGATGQITSNGETIEVVMCWGPGPQFDIFRFPWQDTNDLPILDDEHLLIRGSCKFAEDEGVVQVIEDKGNLLNGVKTITFTRHNINEVAR